MKYFLFPTIAGAANQQWRNQGKNNIHHHHSYNDNERDLYTWVLMNDGREWHHTTDGHWNSIGNDGQRRGQQQHVARGLARAVWELHGSETIQVDTQWWSGGSWGQLGYDTRGEGRNWGGPQQNSGENRGSYDDSLQLAFTTLATARSPGGTYTEATQPYGTDNRRGPNYYANHDGNYDWANCRVVGVFNSNNRRSSWGGNNAQDGGVGDAAGIVLYTARNVNLNWDSAPKDLCEASQASNRELADRNGNRNGRDDGLSGGVIAAIVLGSIAFVALVIVLVCCFCCKGDSGASSI